MNIIYYQTYLKKLIILYRYVSSKYLSISKLFTSNFQGLVIALTSDFIPRLVYMFTTQEVGDSDAGMSLKGYIRWSLSGKYVCFINGQKIWIKMPSFGFDLHFNMKKETKFSKYLLWPWETLVSFFKKEHINNVLFWPLIQINEVKRGLATGDGSGFFFERVGMLEFASFLIPCIF